MDSVISILETFTKQQKHVFLLMEKLLRNNTLNRKTFSALTLNQHEQQAIYAMNCAF